MVFQIYGPFRKYVLQLCKYPPFLPTATLRKVQQNTFVERGSFIQEANLMLHAEIHVESKPTSSLKTSQKQDRPKSICPRNKLAFGKDLDHSGQNLKKGSPPLVQNLQIERVQGIDGLALYNR